MTFKLTEKQEAQRNLAAGAAQNILAYGGSRSGKTFGFCYCIGARAIMAAGSRHAVFRRHGVAVKQSIGKDTFPKMLALAFPSMPYTWHAQDGYFSFANGSEVWLAGLDDKERVDKVLGREFATLYFNEASEIPLDSYFVAQTRLAQSCKKSDGRDLRLKSYVDLNPTTNKHWTYRMWLDGVNPDGEKPLVRAKYAHIVMNPMDNVENLPPDYLESFQSMGERKRKRFFEGLYQSDVESALWRRSYIKRKFELPDMVRIVVAIDPAVSANIGSDETGLIVAGIDGNGHGYILADESGQYRPEEWAQRAISLYHQFSADVIVGEVNQGGDMIESVLRAQMQNVSYKSVHATRGKVTRAEPISSLYERGLVWHVGEFSDLEDQMCSFTSNFDRKAQGYSPDRVDALVWAMSELFDDMIQPVRRVIDLSPRGGSWMI